MIISECEAKRFILNHQGLLPPKSMSTEDDLYKFIKKVGCIQFDPLNKVGFNSHLVIQSRIKEYNHNI